MAKYRVYAIATASWLIGEYEADTPEKAQDLALEDDEGIHYARLCYRCAEKVEVGDDYETEAEEI